MSNYGEVFLYIGLVWAFIATYLLRYNILGASPEISPQYIPWIALHGTIALIPLFGATCLILVRLTSRKGNHFNRHHRYYGRVFLLLWGFTHLGGIVNFWLFKSLWVLFPAACCAQTIVERCEAGEINSIPRQLAAG